MTKRLNINPGDKFNMLSIIREVEIGIKPSGQKYRRIECLCDCGSIKEYHLGHISNGKTKSCGCYGKKILEKHGLYKHKLYSRWSGIRDRCNNKNNNAYKNYGGRGIKCDWGSFTDFLNDMGLGYIDGMQIDRVDNNGNYCKENCIWVTPSQNNRNKRTNKFIEYKGLKKSLVEWGEYFKIPPANLNYYINKGLSLNDIILLGIIK